MVCIEEEPTDAHRYTHRLHMVCIEEDPHSAPVFSAGGLVRARGAWEHLASNQEPPTLSFSSPATSVHLVMSLD